MEIHGALLTADQEQPRGTVTLTLSLVAQCSTVMPGGASVAVQGAPACVTLNDRPAIDSDPVRDCDEGFG